MKVSYISQAAFCHQNRVFKYNSYQSTILFNKVIILMCWFLGAVVNSHDLTTYLSRGQASTERTLESVQSALDSQ